MPRSDYPRDFVWGRNHRDRLNLAQFARNQLQRANTSAAISQIANMRLIDRIFGVERGKLDIHSLKIRFLVFDPFHVSDEAYYVQLLGILQFLGSIGHCF